MVTTAFEALADTVYRSKWYEYDFSIRQCVILLLAIHQKPLQFHGLKLIDLSLMTFTKVLCYFSNLIHMNVFVFMYFFILLQLMKISVTYYLMFKSFSQTTAEIISLAHHMNNTTNLLDF